MFLHYQFVPARWGPSGESQANQTKEGPFVEVAGIRHLSLRRGAAGYLPTHGSPAELQDVEL
jgi:hypothetical protein